MKKKILIVDDNIHYASLLSLFLQDHGYETKIVFDGDNGLDIISKEDFDAWIIDHWLLGSPNGIDFVRAARDMGFKTNALIITCLIPSEVELQTVGLGIVSVMDKLVVGTPFFLSQLEDALRPS